MKRTRASIWTRSKEGYCQTKDGRFRISPQYEGTTKPQSYRCDDALTGKSWSADSQKFLKFDVKNILEKASAKEEECMIFKRKN